MKDTDSNLNNDVNNLFSNGSLKIIGKTKREGVRREDVIDDSADAHTAAHCTMELSVNYDFE